MTAFQKFRDGDIGPVLILTVICFVITLALAGVYQMTASQIAVQEVEAANLARQKVLPQGDSFTMVEGIEYPDGVFEIHKADNGAGMVFRSGAKGFDGIVTYMIGMDKNGEIVGINMFEHGETPGLGTKIGEPSYLELYYGNADETAIDGISGATKTTNSLKNAITQAKKAFELAKGVL